MLEICIFPDFCSFSRRVFNFLNKNCIKSLHIKLLPNDFMILPNLYFPLIFLVSRPNLACVGQNNQKRTQILSLLAGGNTKYVFLALKRRRSHKKPQFNSTNEIFSASVPAGWFKHALFVVSGILWVSKLLTNVTSFNPLLLPLNTPVTSPVSAPLQPGASLLDAKV